MGEDLGEVGVIARVSEEEFDGEPTADGEEDERFTTSPSFLFEWPRPLHQSSAWNVVMFYMFVVVQVSSVV